MKGGEGQVLRLRLVFVAIAAALVTFGAVSAGASVGASDERGTPNKGVVACRAGFKPAIIGGNLKCLRRGQPCKARYQAGYHKYGFQCVSGHLRRWSPPPPPEEPLPPPPPPSPPPAQPGHYKGSTSQLTTFEFDVVSGGYGVTSIVTGQVNQGCTPHFSLYGGQIKTGTYVIPIASDGSFALSYEGSGTVGSSPATGRTSITGHMSGATAVGTLEETTNFTWTDGIYYQCGSGLQTWTATRIG